MTAEIRYMHLASDAGRIGQPEGRDWGMREFYVWDPVGDLLKFGQSVAPKSWRSLE